MFSHALGDDAQLRLLLPWHAVELYELIDYRGYEELDRNAA